MDRHTMNRLECARQLADILDEAGCEAADVPVLDTKAWRLAALAAGSRRGKAMSEPSEATKTLVFARLTERERLATTYPLEGLPA